METTRIDRWLWTVRLFKTRGAANEACRAGHVRINGNRVKPATPVRVGDTVEARGDDRQRLVQVRRIVASRVGAPEAAECLTDSSPPPSAREERPSAPRRDRGAGRPSKRERRQLDRLRRRSTP